MKVVGGSATAIDKVFYVNNYIFALFIILNFSLIEVILYPIIYHHINKILNKTASSGILRPELIQVKSLHF